MALIAECAELVEHFQWLSEAQSQDLAAEKRELVALEMADSDLPDSPGRAPDIDLIDSANRKLAINEQRYPKSKVFGDARRADEY